MSITLDKGICLDDKLSSFIDIIFQKKINNPFLPQNTEGPVLEYLFKKSISLTTFARVFL